MSIIAEGVETTEQLDYLEIKKCAEIQGFLYSPALPALECGQLIRIGKPAFVITPDVMADVSTVHDSPLINKTIS